MFKRLKDISKRRNEQKRQILYFGFDSNSHLYNNYIMAKDLIETGLYEITFLAGPQNPYKDKLQMAGMRVIDYSHIHYFHENGTVIRGLYHQFPMWLLDRNNIVIKELMQ